jgi:hypothetical protein
MAMTSSRTNHDALEAYVDAQDSARTLLAQLTAQLAAHQDTLAPREINWGHVGDITHIVTQLEALVTHT